VRLNLSLKAIKQGSSKDGKEEPLFQKVRTEQVTIEDYRLKPRFI
jgi:hypothetical protein